MASLFDPGLLGITSPLKCSCQELLSLSSHTQHGWLRRKCRRNKLHTKLKVFDWPQFYVIVSDKCLYYYKNETSKKPAGAVSLYGYNRVCRSNDIKASEVPWCFKIEHVQPEMKSFYFSVSSEQDMIKWMKAFKEEMLEANNLGKRTIGKTSQSDESESSWGSSEYSSLEDPIYGDSTGESRVSVISEAPFDDEDSSGSETDIRKKIESALVLAQFDGPVPRKGNTPKGEKKKNDQSNKFLKEPDKNDQDNTDQETDDYWTAVHFPGSKAEASAVISGIAFNGAYLVRKSEDGLNVLQVYTDDASSPRKYKIYITGAGQHTLSDANGPYFDSLEDLLFYYYSTRLPHTEHCLTVPYRLHPEFINNEKY